MLSRSRLPDDSRSQFYPPCPAWYGWGLLGIFLISLGLRFWGLERFNTLVFDEVYYVKFANNYLTHTPFFDGHPPLSKYIIAMGMAIGNKLPWGQTVVNDFAGSIRSTWSYRWLNALLGSCIPLVIAGLTYYLSFRPRFALLAGFLAAVDGLFLVESRYALNNIHLVLFGLLGQVCFLIAARQGGWKSWLWLPLAGSFFGAAVSVKWNGLWFLLATYALWLPTAIFQLMQLAGQKFQNLSLPAIPWQGRSLGEQIGRLNPIAVLLGLCVIPTLVYYLLWIPHLIQNPSETFIELQKKIFAYHQGSSVMGDVHPYCSTWNTWLSMRYPVVYFYRRGIDPTQVLVPNSADRALADSAIYDVHSMGNPALWWLSTLAIGITLAVVFLQTCFKITDLFQPRPANPVAASPTESTPVHQQARLRFTPWANRLFHAKPLSSDHWIAVYLAINYLTNLLPWTRISRCAFLYHYMGSLIFATIALAWWFDRALQNRNPDLKTIVQLLVVLIVLAFIWWMPVYLGLPLDETGYRLRMWFDTWICGIRCPKL
ncbi:MAG: phospholipid carrier-dependent glycosyltransferase [Synechococcales bacterium]|nr:phospholipid carrier-dependent glycosyltransferase [Synechococcales bacterium]